MGISFADLVATAADYGPIAAIVLFLVWLNGRQSDKMLDGLLGGLREVREAQVEVAAQQAAAVAELKGIRSDLVRTEASLQRLAERSTEHGETIKIHGERLADHARRIERLEGGISPSIHRPRD